MIRKPSELFRGYDEQTRAFYQKIFNSALINLHAVKNGYFNTRFCETDDPVVIARWRAELPVVIKRIQDEMDKNRPTGE